MDRLTLYEQLRLIERSESEVSGAWKGAHLLLFFLAFVFGSFCTFCFHMLMYLFDEQCVLFPKLLSLTSLRHNVIFEFIPENKERADMLPVDFLSTQWVEKSACYLPTYVPLVSGIFGLVWTTMFLMCSTGSRTLTGFQRPWRIIPPVFVFSLAMSGLCIYSSSVTHYGLQELCVKLGEITGSPSCSYTVNVATLAYERKIRGVYQATRLTITSAWLHTGCWLASALVALMRILLAVDFRLVNVRAELVGNLDQMLERHEEQLRIVSPYLWKDDESDADDQINSLVSISSTHIFFHSDKYDENTKGTEKDDIHPQLNKDSRISLVPEEHLKLISLETLNKVREEHQFIVNMLYDLIDEMEEISHLELRSDTSSSSEKSSLIIVKQLGNIISLRKAEEIREEIMNILMKILQLVGLVTDQPTTSTSENKAPTFETTLSITEKIKQDLEEIVPESDKEKDSNLQPDKSSTKQSVTISKAHSLDIDPGAVSVTKKDAETQTERKKKEKQD